MTLVIAGIRNGRIFIISDTQITLPGGSIGQPQLKIAFPNNDVAIAFAGSPELADKDVTRFIKNGDFSYEFARSFFAEASERTGVDYLLCFASIAKIMKFCSRKFAKVESLDWIGDYQAYSAIQNQRRGVRTGKYSNLNEWVMNVLPDVTGIENVFEWVVAFRAAIETRSLATVGGFFTVTMSNEGAFGLSAHILNYADRTSLLPDEKGRYQLLSTGENAKFRAVTLPPKPAHISAALFGFPADGYYRMFAPSEGRPFGYLRGSITDMSMEEAVQFALQQTGVEFVPHDAWPV